MIRSRWPGCRGDHEPIVFAGRIDPAVEHDRCDRPGRRRARIGRLAKLGYDEMTSGGSDSRSRSATGLAPDPSAALVILSRHDPRSRQRVQGRGRDSHAAQHPAAQLEPDGFALAAAQREHFVRLGHRADHQPIDRAPSSLIPRIRQLDHVIAVGRKHRRQPGVGRQPRRIVGGGDVGSARPRRGQPDARVDPRADPRALGVDQDPLPLLAVEPKEIDVVARDLSFHDQRRIGDLLRRLERAVVFFFRDLRQLADRQQERIRDPVVGLDPDRIDPDRSARVRRSA